MRIIIITIFTIGVFTNSAAQIVTLRVNMHYILRNDGTGNFTETSDGLGLIPDYNGFKHAEYLVKLINTLLPQNSPMKYQPFGPVDNPDPEIRFQLNGVFFHRNSTLFQTSNIWQLESNYNENVGEIFNIYFVGDLGGSGGYSPGIGGNTDAVIGLGLITSYQNWVNENFDDWQNKLFALCIVHEIGHCLNLRHTIRTDSGCVCSDSQDDGCSDTPTKQEIEAYYGVNPCAEWCDSTTDNNLMGCNCLFEALSPCQIDRMHENINSFKQNFINSNYTTSNLNICTISGNQSYIAQDIQILNGCSNSTLLVSGNTRVFIDSETVEINNGFEVDENASFIIK